MKYLVEYVWIGGNMELRSKSRVLENLEHIPDWNYDGSSTGQAEGRDSEVILKPRAVFKCPFRKGENRIVLCDTYLPNGEPHNTNKRNWAQKIFEKYGGEIPWYGLEQEYFMLDVKTGWLYGVEILNLPKQGKYYCGTNVVGRQIAEEHLEACLYAGIGVSGINAEVAPSQWEFQVGSVVGIDAGDQLWMARYLLERIGEKYGVTINYSPKPFKGDINGTGCHCNFSTKKMRDDGGLKVIEEAIEKLSVKHLEHMELYGLGNRERMTGKHETASYDVFSCGRANRGCSIRIPNETIKNGKGYFEDRRPAGNCDPYLVTAKIMETIMN